jgi:hypothetical protein
MFPAIPVPESVGMGTAMLPDPAPVTVPVPDIVGATASDPEPCPVTEPVPAIASATANAPVPNSPRIPVPDIDGTARAILPVPVNEPPVWSMVNVGVATTGTPEIIDWPGTVAVIVSCALMS